MQLRAGNAAEAASACDEALKMYPGDANFLCLAARAELAQSKFDEAKRFLEEATRRHPDFAVAHDVSGDVLLAQGYASTAIRAYEQALRLDPTRSTVLKKIEKAEQLIAAAKKSATQIARQSTTGRRMAFAEEIHNAEQLAKSGDSRQAEEIYRGILKRDPNHVEAARLLARIAMEKKHFSDAEVFLRHAASFAPDYGRLWVDLTNVYRELDEQDKAMDCATKVLELAPEMAESHILHAGVLGMIGRHDEAIRAYEKALQIDPNRPGALCSMGHHLKTIGKQEQAIATYRQCLHIKPDHAEAYWSLANLKTFRFDDREVAAMQALLDDEDLVDESRVQIHNALGLDSEAGEQYDTAFSHFEQCNRLRRKVEKYDPVDTETSYDQLIDIFNEEFLKKNTGVGTADASPIFVVGLPRSGSTLIEQILASHSMVDGTHELRDLQQVVKRIREPARKNSRFSELLQDLSADEWHKIGEDYIESTRKYRAGAPHFIDKNPNNFVFVGLIRLALPNAKIINARRHPLDSGFGTYKQLFASGQPFSYDLTELGEYYLQYLRLMDHWQRLLPGFVLDVQYEQVVADLETQVRRLLDFCGLPFEESCLRFYETDRAVKTASSEQVRRPIYASSVNLWRNYEHHLGELVEVLQPVLDRLPAANQPSKVQKNTGASRK
jgi:tetratricopeptide (TPR) repeat protein